MNRIKNFLSKASECKLLKSEKFNFVMTTINILVIVGLIIGLIVTYVGNNGKKEIDASGTRMDVEQSVNDVDVESLVEKADSSMIGVYEALIRGSDFDCGNGIEFHFGYEGEYSGFFDAKNKNVEGYSYEVLSEEGKTFKLRILNSDATRYVEYEMEFNKDGNLLLTYPGMEQSILLEF